GQTDQPAPRIEDHIGPSRSFEDATDQPGRWMAGIPIKRSWEAHGRSTLDSVPALRAWIRIDEAFRRNRLTGKYATARVGAATTTWQLMYCDRRGPGDRSGRRVHRSGEFRIVGIEHGHHQRHSHQSAEHHTRSGRPKSFQCHLAVVIWIMVCSPVGLKGG